MSNSKKTKIKKVEKSGNGQKDLKASSKKDKKTLVADVASIAGIHSDEEAEEIPAIAGIIGDAGVIAEDADPDFHPSAVLADEEPETAETPEEVGFDDLTDDEREMLGLEAKPKAAVDDEAEPANTGASWEEFGYEEEELE